MICFPAWAGESHSPTPAYRQAGSSCLREADEFPFYAFSSRSLLKTFSKSRFDGQYLKRAETTVIAPINPTPSQKIPETKKDRTIRMLPKMDRTSDSFLPTFFVLTIGLTSSPC